MKKSQKTFLCISLTVFVILLVLLSIATVLGALEEYKNSLNDDIFGPGFSLAFYSVVVFLIVPPILLAELSLIKNVYTLLKDNQSKIRKTLCIISSVLALSVFVFYVVLLTVDFETKASEAIMLSSWPCVIVSFILGSKHICAKK